MPGPVIPTPKLPWWADPKKESVTDPLLATLARRAVSLTGLDDPQSQVLQAGIPVPLVAGVKPSQIPILKKTGKALLERVKREGLQQQYYPGIPASLPPTYVPTPKELGEVLEFAQKRYPRIFGHITDIADVDRTNQLTAGPFSEVRGTSGAAENPTGKFSFLGLSPRKAWVNTPSKAEFAETVGHELSHNIQRLMDPKYHTEKSEFFQKLPGGYVASSKEVLARLGGESFAKKFLASQKPSSAMGWVKAWFGK